MIRAEAVPPVQIYTAGGVGSGALREVIEADLGLEVDVIQVDWPEFNAGMAQREYPGLELLWGADYPDPETFLWSLFHSESPDNYIGYENPCVDELLEAAEIEADDAERERLYLEAQQLVIDDGVLLPLYHDVSCTVVKRYVRDLCEWAVRLCEAKTYGTFMGVGPANGWSMAG